MAEAGRQTKRLRVLALGGGGLRGALSAAMLVRLEDLLRSERGPDARLSDAFDLIGGVSTGGVMATGAALGLSAREIADFYLVQAPKVFQRSAWRVPLLHPLYCADALRSHFAAVTDGRRLRRGDLETDLALVVKNAATSTPTVLSTLAARPGAPRSRLGAELSGAPVDLADALRATTAAPGLFAPIALPIGPGGALEACVDGGLTPFNNPSHLLWALALSQPCVSGVDVISVGAGSGRPMRCSRRIAKTAPGALAFAAFKSMIVDGEEATRALMTEEAADAPAATDGASSLRFAHLDMPLTKAAFDAAGVPIDASGLAAVRDIANPTRIRDLFEAARWWAERQLPDWPFRGARDGVSSRAA